MFQVVPTIFRWIFTIFTFLGVAGFILFSLIGITLLFFSYLEKNDANKRKKLKKWGLLAIFVPIGLIFLGLIGSIITGFLIEVL